MLNDFNSWWRMWAEKLPFVDTSDGDYKQAVENCYSALCYNSGNSVYSCPRNIDDVGQVIIAYISLFTKQEIVDKDSKYKASGGKYYGYYDEWNDKLDPYRKALISVIAKGIGRTDNFVNDVLSYLYWGIKRGKVPQAILRPAGVERFREKDWYIKEPWKSLFKISDATLRFINQAFSTTAEVIEGALDGLGGTAKAIGWLANNWYYVLGGGVVLFIGGQIYFKNKNGKFVGEDIVRKRVGL